MTSKMLTYLAAPLVAVTVLASSANADPHRQTSAQGTRLYQTKQNGGYAWVDRAQLPGHGQQRKQRIEVLKQAMEDEITGQHAFTNRNDTPAFEIVAHNANLHQVAEAGYSGANQATGGYAVYDAKLSDLQNGKLKTTLLLPVSGHVGISSAQQYARSNVFRVQVNGGAWTEVRAQGKYITETDMELLLKPGRNEVKMEPYAGGHGGYSEGRTIYINVK